MRIVVGAASALAVAALAVGAASSARPAATTVDGGSCARLQSVSIAHTAITLAQPIDGGGFTPPGAASDAANRTLPAFCRVAALLTPTDDSRINIEVWLPVAGWNGKFQAVGNGAFNGSIAYAAMSSALARGYATSSTDTGHTGNTASFAAGHPEKTVDFGWRAVHEMTLAAKRIIAAYYDTAPRLSYWTGCSAGGRQALKEAQRFPADFDGIVAGAPGLDWTGRASQAVRLAQALERDDARLSSALIRLVHAAALAACDASDGVADGVIDNPAVCRFDPGVLACASGAPAGSCLSAAQVATVRLMYSPLVNRTTRREIGGLARGSELGWTERGWSASARATGLDQFRFLVFADPGWTVAKFDGDADAARAEEADADTINALDPNLKPFFDRGGKLIQYHGWSDPQISPFNSTQYYARVAESVGAAAIGRSYRLFMAPGLAHCGGGDGPNSFDMAAALEQWVEQGRDPDRIVAAHRSDGRVDRTRPLCPYPRSAVYTHSGSTDDAANFICR